MATVPEMLSAPYVQHDQMAHVGAGVWGNLVSPHPGPGEGLTLRLDKGG